MLAVNVHVQNDIVQVSKGHCNVCACAADVSMCVGTYMRTDILLNNHYTYMSNSPIYCTLHMLFPFVSHMEDREYQRCIWLH